jgi:16S rRNA (guanine527-N7)-methyltransferase
MNQTPNDNAAKWDKGPAADAQRRARLVDAAASMQLGLGDAVVDRLMAYLALMQQWNKVYNLTALRHPDEMLSHHLLDCLAVLPPLRRHLGMDATGAAVAPAAPQTILDVGSGGGLPGVVLAAAEPSWQVSCVDAVGKKATFVRQVAAELRLPNLRGLHARVETLAAADAGTGAGAKAGYDVITSRAFASLHDFVSLTAHLLAPGGVWMAMKGKQPDEEVAALPADVEVFHVEQLSVPGLDDAQRCLIWMRRRPN